MWRHWKERVFREQWGKRHITMPIHPSIELHSYIVFIALVWAKNVQLTANLEKLHVMSMGKCGL